jgi:tetratricopeptide (TPR) repeat protein
LKKISKILVISIVLPILILILVELFLNIIQIGYPTNLFLKGKTSKGSFYHSNYRVGYRFFPGYLARKPLPEIFPVKKAENTYRIFVLGESAARGEQLADFSFSRMLQVMLKTAFPKTKFEIINTGIPAINSWVIREFTKELVNYNPDLFIIYAGHNEFVGPYGPGTVFKKSKSRTANLIGIWASKLKLIQLIKSFQNKTNNNKSWTGLEMFLKNKILPESPAISFCKENFQKNLNDILTMIDKAKAKSIICTVPSNLKDCAPFMPNSKISDQERDKISKLLDSDKFAECHTILKKLAATNPNNALIKYLEGKVYYKQKLFVKAQKAFTKARDLDCFKVRTISNFNQATASEAAKFKTNFIELESEFNQASNITDKSLIYDHVHLTEKGHYLVAQKLFEKIISQKLLPANQNIRPCTFAEVLDKLGYSSKDKQMNLEYIIASMKELPFTLQLTNKSFIAQTGKKLASLLKTNSKFDIENTTKALTFSDTNWAAAARLALLYQEKGYPEEALVYFNKSLEINPFNIDALNNRSILLYKMKKYDHSEYDLKRALKLAPNFARAYFNLARLRVQKNQLNESIKNYKKAIEIDPSFSSAYLNLANIYFKQENFQSALKLYQKLQKHQPNNPMGLIGEGNVLMQKKDPINAINSYKKCIASFPNSSLPYYSLGKAYQKTNNLAEAYSSLKKAYQLAPASMPCLKSLINFFLTENNKFTPPTADFIPISVAICKATNYQSAYYLQILASAYSQNKQYDHAISVLSQALDIANKNGNIQQKKEISENLKILSQTSK